MSRSPLTQNYIPTATLKFKQFTIFRKGVTDSWFQKLFKNLINATDEVCQHFEKTWERSGDQRLLRGVFTDQTLIQLEEHSQTNIN